MLLEFEAMPPGTVHAASFSLPACEQTFEKTSSERFVETRSPGQEPRRYMKNRNPDQRAETSPVAASRPPIESGQPSGGKQRTHDTILRPSPVQPLSQDSQGSAHLTVGERQAYGRALRDQVPHERQAAWHLFPDRPNPIELLERQAQTRLSDLVPIRYQRMLASPLAFLRGAAIVMAHDLGHTPTTGISVQLCGDCHLANFGVYGSPERSLLFDLNDFDETLPGPWEWDVKRLAASLMVAGRVNGFNASESQEAALQMVQTYRTQMRVFAGMPTLEVWYAHLNAEDILQFFTSDQAQSKKRTKQFFQKARSQDQLKALSKLTEVVNDRRQIIPDPPLVMPIPTGTSEERIASLFQAYQQTLREDQGTLLDRYRVVDAARKVVGVGSVGTRCYIVLLEGRDAQDPLFLQVKEAESSVLEASLPRSTYVYQGQRVVAGQRLMQAASDIFLGWMRGDDGRDYYWRQLKDMKGALAIEETTPVGLAFYGGVCGWALARAHARSGDCVQIAAYLGKSDVFDQAIMHFADAYATQTERDYQALVEAVKARRIIASSGS
jgi:uncharacterized protein (DUF2252 family)